MLKMFTLHKITRYINFINSYEEFMRILPTSMEGNVPKRIKRSKKRNIYMNNEATRLKNKKQKLWKKYVASKSAEDHDKFVKCKNKLRSLTRTLRKDFEKALANKIKNNPKPFWSYVQSKLKTKVKIPTLTKLDGTKAYNSKEKAEALNEYFGSVYQDESDNIPPATKNFSGIPLVSVEITHEMVMDKLNALNPGKSTGLDRLHPYFLP